jgi:acyl-CoA synthetase (AMP-forming)/AMP-acid ligase II
MLDPIYLDEFPRWLGGADTATALIAPETGLRLTFGELDDRVEHLARQLLGLGVQPGDTVSYSLSNGPESVAVFLAVRRAGAAAAPLNPAYTIEEIVRYLADLHPVVMIVQRGTRPAAATAARTVGAVVAQIEGEPASLRLSMDTAGTTAGTLPDPDPEAVALLLHTSGTTGRPKVVPIRQRNLMASARAIAAHYQLSPDDVSHCVMPLFHVHGLVASTLAPLISGGSVIVPRRFSNTFWAHGQTHAATWFSAVPTIHQTLLARPDSEIEHPHQLRFARSCSASLAATVMGAFEKRFAIPLVEAYGMTEASHQMAANPLPPAERRPGSVGLSAGAEIGVVAPDWSWLPAGAVGEVVVKGPGVVDGYLANPEANEASFRDGWFRTGDSGSLDSDGYLRLAGRIKELINRAGEKISPIEIEEVLLKHPSVGEVVAFGVPDERYGESVAIAVVLRDTVTERALRAHCSEHLARFKVPSRVVIVKEIPKGPTGKIQRRLLPELLGAE